MRRPLLLLAITVVFLSACSSGESKVARADYEKAMAFFQNNNPEQGFAYLHKAMDEGSAIAAEDLGYLTLKGNGVTKSATGALAYFLVAAERGSINGQYNAGLAYARGEGTQKNLPEAAKWFLAAAYQGDAGAEFNIGLMHINGEGVPRDLTIAHAWLSLAADQEYQGAKGAMTFVEGDLDASSLKDARVLKATYAKNIRRVTPEHVSFSDTAEPSQ